MVPWLYEKLMEDLATSWCRWQTVRRPIRTIWKKPRTQKLMEGPADTWKVDNRSRGHTDNWEKVPQIHKSWQKLTEGPAELRKLIEGHAAVWKVNGRSCGRMKSCQKLTKCSVDEKKVDVRSRGFTKNWRNVLRTHSKMTEVDRKSSSSAESLMMVSPANDKFTEVNKNPAAA